jgi:hypothetical protein
VVPIKIKDFHELNAYITAARGPTVFIISSKEAQVHGTFPVLVNKPNIVLTSSLSWLKQAAQPPKNSELLQIACNPDEPYGPLLQIK